MKLIKHFITITRHRHMVMKYCFKCGLYMQGVKHDLSKYSPTEFFASFPHYTGTHSPLTEERYTKGYSSSWIHHKGRNKHHPEYWVDIDLKTNTYKPKRMPDSYIAEMFCDRIAASINYNIDSYKKGTFDKSIPLNYLLTHDTVIMHPSTKRKIIFLLEMYRDKKEKEVFKYIKNNLRKKKLLEVKDILKYKDIVFIGKSKTSDELKERLIKNGYNVTSSNYCDNKNAICFIYSNYDEIKDVTINCKYALVNYFNSSDEVALKLEEANIEYIETNLTKALNEYLK